MTVPLGNRTRSPVDAPTLRGRIRQVAEALYVVRGHEGFSFGDVARAVGTTRANIHHHFGNKPSLMAELIEGFAADARHRTARCWAAGDRPFADRMEAQIADLRRFYDRFNPESGDRNVWSPLSRLRLDLPTLGDMARAALEDVNAAYDHVLSHAVDAAVTAGELAPSAPRSEIVRMLRTSLLVCPPITQDTGSFDDIERWLRALAHTILRAWAGDAPAHASGL